MYKSLNDANLPELQPGPAKVWYAKPGPDLDLAFGSANARQYRGVVIDPANMDHTHVLLGSIVEPASLERVWSALQGENWSPNGEARQLIEKLGLLHTSMSVGDCIEIDGKVMMVEFCGWGEIRPIAHEDRAATFGSDYRADEPGSGRD